MKRKMSAPAACLLGMTLLFPSARGAEDAPAYTVPGDKFVLDGSSGYEVIPYDPDMARPAESGQVTLSAWVYVKDPSRQQIVFKREGAWQLALGAWDAPRGLFSVWSPEIQSLVSEPVLRPEEWQHLAATYDGETLSFYVNGALLSSAPAAHGAPAANEGKPLWVGVNLPPPPAGPEMVFDGEMAGLKVWDRALGAEEIADLAAGPPDGVSPGAPADSSSAAPPAAEPAASTGPGAPAPAAPVSLEGDVGGVPLALQIGPGIRLGRIGSGVAARGESGGSLFTILVSGRKISSDQVAVHPAGVVTGPDGWTIPFDLPGNAGIGTLRFFPGGEPGVINTRLELANGGPAGVWRVLFPLVEGVTLDGRPPGDLEFFFPFQEGWLGQGECSLGVTYGFRGWLPVLAAWHPGGTGLSLQVRDDQFDVCSLLFRNASPGGAAGPAPADNAPGQLQKSLYGESYHPDILYSAEAFPLQAPGLTLGVATAEFPLGSTRKWESRTFALQVYDGGGLFKTPLSSYGQWARANWWQRGPVSPSVRDMFLAFAVQERGGNAGFAKGLHDGKKYLLGDQAEAFARETGGAPFTELFRWWRLGDEVASGPHAGRFFPHTKGDYEFEPRRGGAEALRAEIARVHAVGGRVCLYVQGRLVGKQLPLGRAHGEEWAYMDKPGHFNLDWNYVDDAGFARDYWNFCPQAEGWQEHLRSVVQRALEGSGADAVRIDSMAETLICYNPRHGHARNPLDGLLGFLATVRAGVKAAGADKTLWVEFCGSDAAALHVDGTLAQGSDPGLPLVAGMGSYGVAPFRFVFPEVKCIDWGNVPADFDNLSKRFLFNGVGITVSDASPAQLAVLTRYGGALRSVGDIIGSLDCEPVVPTLAPGLVANRFSLADREVYTLWNRSGAEVRGPLLRVPGKDGRRFVEMLTGRELRTVRRGEGDEVEFILAAGEVALLGIFPRIIRSAGNNFSCPPPAVLRAVDASTGRVIANGGQKLEFIRPAAGTFAVQAVADGYLVQDQMEAGAGS